MDVVTDRKQARPSESKETAGRQMHSGPAKNHFGTEPGDRCDPEVNRMAGLAQGDGRNGRNPVEQQPSGVDLEKMPASPPMR